MNIFIIVSFATILFSIMVIWIYIDEYKANEPIRNKAKIGRKIYSFEGNDVEVYAKMQALFDEKTIKWQKERDAENEAFSKAEITIFPSNEDSNWEMGEKGGRTFVRRKSHTGSMYCKYCGSYKSDNHNCTQCGAPVW